MLRFEMSLFGTFVGCKRTIASYGSLQWNIFKKWKELKWPKLGFHQSASFIHSTQAVSCSLSRKLGISPKMILIGCTVDLDLRDCYLDHLRGTPQVIVITTVTEYILWHWDNFILVASVSADRMYCVQIGEAYLGRDIWKDSVIEQSIYIKTDRLMIFSIYSHAKPY